MRLPIWVKKHSYHQVNALWFITLGKSQLENSQLDLITGSSGLGQITLTREALSEVVVLMREGLKEIS
jgi:hypothetical protein